MAIKFYRKNILDLSMPDPTITIADAIATNTGEDFTDLMRNRNNNSGWMTTGSTDAAITTMVVEFADTRTFDNILLLGHNLKNFTIKYDVLGVWTAFSTPIAPTANTAASNYYSFTPVTSGKIQIVMNSTQVVDADKFIKQLIVTEVLGTLSIQPEIEPQWDKDRKATKFLSGKSFVAKSVGAFNVRVRMKAAFDNTDLTLVEALFASYEGFLLSLSGGDTSDYSDNIRQGYRLEDVFLMDLVNEYSPEFVTSRWAMGLPIDLKMVEVS